jgi:uncharacterized protein DUF4349
MRGPDSDPLGPEIAGALMAVDATLAGDPVDPEYAELAELALILRRERPRTSDAFAARLDERVERRFARPAPAARGTGLRRRLGGSLAGLAAAAAATLLVLVISNGSHGSSNSVSFGAATVSSSSSAAATSSAAAGASGSAGAAASGKVSPDAKRLGLPAGPHAASANRAEKSAASSAASGAPTSTSAGAATSTSAAAPQAVIPTPTVPGNRQVVQSAQLILGVAASRIDDVSQQVFNVVGQEKGYVNGSNVTSSGGPDSNAFFQLSVPSSNLAATLAALSELKGAHVVSRTDNTNDITAQVGGAGQQLAEARALRRSLLKQLANATTTAQVTSIQARLHDANASIASDLSKLRGLQRQVAYSNVTLRIQSNTAPPPVTHHHSSGFTIGSAAHDAGRVLVVVAGVSLIVLAVLVPIALVGALVAWVGFAIRRRRRDQALDLV